MERDQLMPVMRQCKETLRKELKLLHLASVTLLLYILNHQVSETFIFFKH